MAFYDRYNKLKRFAKILFDDFQFVETGEWNEMQSIRDEREGKIGDNVFGAISLRSGGSVVIDAISGSVLISESVVWAGGYFHTVPERTLTGVPMVGTVPIGVVVETVIVNGIDDPSLLGIVPGSESQGEMLASRIRYDARWALAGDPFYPVFTIIDGLLPNEVATPQNSGAELAVERHIVETHGSHIVDGFRVVAGGYNADTNEQTLILGAGTLRAYGRRVARAQDQRYRKTETPTLVQVNGESHVYPNGGLVPVNNGPIDSVQTAIVIKEVVRTVTHQLAGGKDNLPDTPVYSIVAVNAGGAWDPVSRTFSGGTTYAVNTSWVKDGDGVSWAPAGAEPAPGTSVTYVYRYSATVVPSAINRQTIQLEGAVVGEPVILSYRYKLPRIDILAIDLEGNVIYIEGISSKYGATPPPVPEPLAPLVRINNQWGIDPILEDIDQRKLTEAEVRALVRTVLNMQDRLSLVELQKDAQERDPSSVKGSFVDPFTSDSQRDLGLPQTAAIVGGILQLPIEVTAMALDIGRDAITLPFVTEAVQSQPFRTLSRKINKYLNFIPLPAIVEITPAVDRWNITNSSTISQATSSFVQVNSYRPDLVGTDLYGTTSLSSSSSTSIQLTSSTQRPVDFLRQITVKFSMSRMGPGENLAALTFDGVSVMPSVTGTKKANAQGIMTGAFTIPPNIRAGTKPVVIMGDGGSRGETSFTGQGTITTQVYTQTTNTITVATTIDPVAQSFALDEARQMTGAHVEFTARGNPTNPVILELRAMDGALPNVECIGEGITPGTFTVSNPVIDTPANWTEINLRFPTLVEAGKFHAIALLTDDADHSVAVAQLGDQSDPTNARGYDARKKDWVRRNPAGGDFFDGSNGVSWLVAPDTDLTYEIMAARYTALTRVFPLGTFVLADINALGISDVMVLLIAQLPSASCKVQIEMVRATGEVLAFEPNSRLQLDSYLTETVQLRMVLMGTEKLSPIVMPECQVLWGHLAAEATYISEANTINLTTGNVKIRTVIDVVTPGVSSVAVDVGGVGSWIQQAAVSSFALGDGWIERSHIQTNYSQPEARERIRLSGTPKDRPGVRKLRSRATEV